MADKNVSWAAWGWLTLLGLMLFIPILGILIDHATAIGSLLFPLFTGMALGGATLLAAMYIKNIPWWWSVALAAWVILAILFHRQLGLLLFGGALGCAAAFFREPILRVCGKLVSWYFSRTKQSKSDHTSL
ncbi:hypothetical protein GC197_11950 [bacterium]|nr:hypothetical protein [bacterium]